MGRGDGAGIELPEVDRVAIGGAAELAERDDQVEIALAERIERLACVGSFAGSDELRPRELVEVFAENMAQVAAPQTRQLQQAVAEALVSLTNNSVAIDDEDWMEPFLRRSYVQLRVLPVASPHCFYQEFFSAIHLRREGETRALCGRHVTEKTAPATTYSWFAGSSRCAYCESAAQASDDPELQLFIRYEDDLMPVGENEWEEAQWAGRDALSELLGASNTQLHRFAPSALYSLLTEVAAKAARRTLAEQAARRLLALSPGERFETLYAPSSAIGPGYLEDIASLADAVRICYGDPEQLPWPDEERLMAFLAHAAEMLAVGSSGFDSGSEEAYLAHFTGRFFPEALEHFVRSRRHSTAEQRRVFQVAASVFAPIVS